MPAVTHTDTKWHDRFPGLGTGPIPIDPYISDTYAALEREHVFRKAWLNVGRVEQIPQLGDYFVKDIVVCQISVIVTRGKDGQLHAFHNVCSHRVNKVVWDQRGTAHSFTCKFHGRMVETVSSNLSQTKTTFLICKTKRSLSAIAIKSCKKR